VAGLVWNPSDVGVSLGFRYPGAEQNITEPEVAIDPFHPETVLVFAIDQSARNQDPGLFSTNRGFRSVDGGRTWNDIGAMPLTDGGPAPDSGDPVVVFDAAGVAYFISLVDPADSSRHIYVYRSHNSGATWETPDIVHGPQEDPARQMCTSVDKEWIAPGLTPGELVVTYTGADYVCSTGGGGNPFGSLEPVGIRSIAMFFTRSTDEGKTWSPRTELWHGYGLGSIPLVTRDGRILVAFWATVASATNQCPSVVGAAVAAFGGGPFGAIVVASSEDQGVTWSYAQFDVCASDAYQASSLFPGLPAFASDSVTGTVYLAYPDYDREDGRTTLILRVSRDSGRTWSDGFDATPGVEAGLPALAGQNGSASFVFVTSGATGTETWVRRSLDEGSSWSQPFRLSSETADRAGGDYIGADMAGGRFVAVWADARDGPLEIRARVGSVT